MTDPIDISITNEFQYGITPHGNGVVVISTPDVEANIHFASASLAADFLQTLYIALIDRLQAQERVGA